MRSLALLLLLAFGSAALGTGCDSGGPGGGGGLRATLGTSDVMIANIAQGSLYFTNTVVVVATVEGAEAVTGVSSSLPWLDARIDSSVVTGPNRARAYIRLAGVQNVNIVPGPATLTLTAGGATAEVTLTTHTGDVRSLPTGPPLLGVQLTHGREAPAFDWAGRVRVADALAGFSVREAAAGPVFRTFATATAAVAPNRVHRVLLNSVTAEGWAYRTSAFAVAARATTSNPATRVRVRSVGGGLVSGTFSPSLTALAASGALVTRGEPGGSAVPHLTGIRSIAPDLYNTMYLLYRDGRVGTVANGLEDRGVGTVGDFDPADIAPDGSLLLRDGSVWITERSIAWRPLAVTSGGPQLTVLPASPETAFVAITAATSQTFGVPAGPLVAASADGRLWTTPLTTGRLTPSGQRLPSAPREIVTSGSADYGARLADGSVWTWRTEVQGNTVSLTAPVQIAGLTAARLFVDTYALIATRADGSVASWGVPFPGSSPCQLFVLCERPELAGLRESTFDGFVRADGKVYNSALLRLEFAGQPPLIPSE